jgi:rubredoxin
MKLGRYRCKDCGLELAVEAPPEKCFCCGSTNIVREGWKQRYKRINSESTTTRR